MRDWTIWLYCTRMRSILRDALAPEQITVTLANPSGVEPVDFTAVTAWDLRIRPPDSDWVSWASTASGVTSDGATLTHPFEGGDVSQPGTYRVMVVMTVPGGTRRAGLGAFQVVDL